MSGLKSCPYTRMFSMWPCQQQKYRAYAHIVVISDYRVGQPSLSNFSYANNFWRPRKTARLTHNRFQVQRTFDYEKMLWTNRWQTYFFFFISPSFLPPSFLSLDGLISSAVDVTTPGLLSCSVSNAWCGVSHLSYSLCPLCLVWYLARLKPTSQVWNGAPAEERRVSVHEVHELVFICISPSFSRSSSLITLCQMR